MHAVATTPAGSAGTRVARLLPIDGGLPRYLRRVGSHIIRFEACSAFTHVTACLLAESPKATLSIEGFDGFVTSTAAPIATGWSEPVAGWDLHPLKTNAFSRRTE